MSASPGTVLTAAAVLSSPLVLMLQQGTITLDDALVRVAICVGICWAALSVVSALAFTPSRAPVQRPTAEAETPAADPTPAE